MSEENKFYVYALLDPRKPGEYRYEKYKFSEQPFYIGKGCDDRPKDHIREAITYRDKRNNKFGTPKCNKIRKIIREYNLEPTIKIVKKNLDEETAFELEEYIIDIIGRMDLKTGPLTNSTSGGNGVRNYVFTEERRHQMSITGIEVQNRPEIKEKNRQTQLKRYKDPVEREKSSEYQREIQNRPEIKALKREQMKKKNPRDYPGAEEKRKESLKLFYKTHPEKAKERDDRMRELAKDPINRKKCIDRVKELWKTKEYRDRMSNRKKQNWSKESREKMRQLGLKIYIIIRPDNSEEECKDLSEFCKHNNLKYRTMNRIANGEIECSEKGYRCYKKGEGEKMKAFWETVYKYKCISPEGKIFKTVRLSVFCKLHGLSPQCMSMVSRGLRSNHKGWVVEKL